MNITSSKSSNTLIAILKEIPPEIVWNQNFTSKNSVQTYQKAIQNFIDFLDIQNIEELRDIKDTHIIAYIKFMKEKKEYAPRTINNRISAISSLFKHLISKHIVRYNPTEGVKRYRIEYGRVEAKVLTPQEVRNMLDSVDLSTIQGLRDNAILHILFFTGCRISEVCNLKIKDFYEEQGFFILDFWIKGGKRNRIAIHQEAQIAIMRYLKETEHKTDMQSYLVLPVRNNRFSKSLNRRISRRTIDKIWNNYAIQAGIKGSTPHSARTTFITQALENKCPIETVQKSVGHSQIKTTQMYDKREAKSRDSASFAVRY